MYWRYARSVGYHHPAPAGDGGALGFVVDNLTEVAAPPGRVFNYASYLTNLLPVCLEAAYGRPAVELYEERLHRPVGAESAAHLNVDGHRLPIVEGQLSLTLRDFARWALLVLHRGRNLAGDRVVPAAWIDDTLTPSPARRAAFEAGDYAAVFPGAEYHNKAWVLDPPAGRLAMLGIHGQFAYLDLPAGLLVAGVASYPTQVDGLLVESLGRFWAALSGATGAADQGH